MWFWESWGHEVRETTASDIALKKEIRAQSPRMQTPPALGEVEAATISDLQEPRPAADQTGQHPAATKVNLPPRSIRHFPTTQVELSTSPAAMSPSNCHQSQSPTKVNTPPFDDTCRAINDFN
jgi:hypothetical protein